MLKIYNFNPNAKYYGLYFTTTPVFLLRDLELIKTVLVKNFDAFPDRLGFADVNDSLFKKNLFSLRGEKWRNVRNLLSPSFTSSKMKMMFTLMSECAVDFAKFLSTSSADKVDINMKDVCSKYTNDVIATCAFGIKVDSMKDPMNKFYIYGKEASNFRGVIRSIKFFFIYNFNTNAKYFGMYFTTTPVFFLRDLELIKTVLVKNFEAFPDRRGFADFNDSLCKKNLFSLRGEKWRNVRNLLSPSFTSSKMKMMFSLMSECAVDFAKFLSTSSADKVDINMKDVCSKYTNDVIATWFGVISIYYLFKNYNFFKRNGIIHLPPFPLFGSTTSMVFRRISFFDFMMKIYNCYPNAKYFGFYFTTTPVFLLRDLELIKTVLVKNFDAFPDRRGFADFNNPLFEKNLFSLHGEKWRNVRNLLSPSFTSSKMKMMFTLMSECAVDFAKFLSTLAADKGDINMKDVCSKYTTDVIATCAFGIKVNSMKDPTNKFYINGKEASNFTGVLRVIGVISIHYFFKNYNFFERNGIIHLPPLPLFGSMISMVFRRISFFNFMLKIYNCYPNAKYFGFYFTTTPVFLLRDLELIKTVLVKNFDAFPDRRGFADFNNPLFEKNLAFQIKSVCAMEYWSILLSIIIGVISIHYLFRNFNLFKRHGIPHIPPVPIFGSAISVIFRRISFVDFIQKVYYFNPNSKYVGFYFMTNPVLVIRDLELIKNILVKNFEAFPDRQGFSNTNDFLFKNNLFSLHGEKWRNVRNLLSPSFTSSKMKMMFTLMSECAVDFVKFISTSPANEESINTKDVFSKYTNDVIATCAFGIKVNSMKDPTNKFYVYGKEASNFRGVIRGIKFLFLGTFPRFSRILNIKIMNDYVSNFFKDIIKTTIATRDAEHITRPDMLQLMMDIRGKEGHRELDIDDMTAQAFIFFLGGFETSSTEMCFAAHEIAANPDIQTKLQQEIDNVLEKSNGEVSYEIINRLEYLDAVINETLRLYPPIGFLERMCKKTYELPSALPDKKPFIIKKDMLVWIPTFPIQRDEKYYDNPEKFDPERFLDNKMHNSSCYMPFGLGPRMCIANRFAMLEVKILLFHLLARYIDDMTAQAFIFFLGGFETSSTAMSFIAHEIAANPEVQTKLQQEIDKVLKESHEEVSYQAISQLEYLDAVMNEALRLYPPIGFLERICEKSYELPSALPNEKPFIVKKGMIFWIPTFAIQRDEKYYNNPEKFDPERFLDNKMHSSSWYMPFGCGPRMCIANRFALLEIKVLLFHILARCDLKPCTKTTSPIKFCKDFMIMPENGFWLNIRRRKDKHPALKATVVDS
ncbi:Cytochrome P450 9e2 [Trachymyrmex cornetzi]|uniref:Cytochrome P450 9e2 n=1 Tax=Trachymyrmex cornetzi TaxID=471704 RepID=A0A195EMZ3_9HYME|nr:Cytochrome P450 9e2 [Trachymyrmex cornetzi]